jgi:hypothetical protein
VGIVEEIHNIPTKMSLLNNPSFVGLIFVFPIKMAMNG